jgi:phosphoglucomutase
MDKIAAHYKVNCYHSLTGFKWIADVIKQREAKERYIGGGEESFGFMIGDFVRDKDSNTSAMIICEFAAWAKAKGSSLYKEIIKIYEEFGCYEERLISLVKKGKSGADEIQQMMVDFRKNTPETVVGIKVKEVIDYQSQEKKNMSTGVIAPTQIPQSNVFQFVLDDDTVITARPSGTEPKIKFYISVNAPLEKDGDYEKLKSQLNQKIDNIIQELNIG